MLKIISVLWASLIGTLASIGVYLAMAIVPALLFMATPVMIVLLFLESRELGVRFDAAELFTNKRRLFNKAIHEARFVENSVDNSVSVSKEPNFLE